MRVRERERERESHVYRNIGSESADEWTQRPKQTE